MRDQISCKTKFRSVFLQSQVLRPILVTPFDKASVSYLSQAWLEIISARGPIRREMSSASLERLGEGRTSVKPNPHRVEHRVRKEWVAA